MTKRGCVVIGLCLAMLGAYVHAQVGNEPAKLELVKLADDLYVIYNDFVPGNTTALITSAGVVLVDDKFEIDHANVLAQLKKVTPQPVRYVINTHYHSDHSGGNAKLQALGAQAVSSEKAREKMLASKQPGLTDLTFDRQMHVRLGGKQVDLYYFGRAHTDGDIVALFPQHRVLASGDIFAFGDRTPELIDYAGGGSAREWPATLDKALALTFDRVVPGHGVVTTRAEMRKFRDSTQTLFTRVKTMVAQKKSKAEIDRMLRSEFKWADLHAQYGLDGVIAEAR
jgi:glyoxylase-like metal-dependent hydrolase (beta-lactamase superfamily II)